MRTRQDIAKWAQVTDEQWNDWHWQISNRITTVEELTEVIPLTEEEEAGIANCLETLNLEARNGFPKYWEC
jgi:lysine 2,3-aminomutase